MKFTMHCHFFSQIIILLLLSELLATSIHAAPATNLLINGDWSQGEKGWVRWKSLIESSVTEQWALTNNTSFLDDRYDKLPGVSFPSSNGPAATAYYPVEVWGYGQFGWYQAVPVPSGQAVTLSSVDWAGILTAWGRNSTSTAEVMLLTIPKNTPLDRIARRITDPPAGATIYKRIFRVGSNVGKRALWPWQHAALSPAWRGTNTITSQGLVLVVLKMSCYKAQLGSWAAWDNLVLEPALPIAK